MDFKSSYVVICIIDGKNEDNFFESAIVFGSQDICS